MTELTNKAQIIRAGALDVHVCVPAGWTDADAKAFADREVICGTEYGWQIRDGARADLVGDPKRVDCESRDGFVHITFDA